MHLVSILRCKHLALHSLWLCCSWRCWHWDEVREKMCKEKDWTQISWFDSRAWCLKACDASTTRHNGAMPNEACMHQFHIEAVRPGWNIFCCNLTKKMLSNLKTLSKIKSKSHTHTCKCPDFDQNSRVLRVNVKSTMARKNRWQQNLARLRTSFSSSVCFVKA